ncbi:beta/gamma crystallin domain-containing protein 2 [Caloenas nicobarica]|uniref:beta/gamma crystallin domain-containing protein 2 n=1 Tax=Caloenas nicobarica TaxID=187106 RepID=UPI0032B74919
MDSPFRHTKSRGFVSSAELSMKQAVPSTPGTEGRSRFQKVSLVSRRLEKTGSARGREGSPSRVSLLLQAWEREIVEQTGSGPTTLTHRERSSSSISLLKDFTAHGPIFSQVYSPAQKPRRQDERGKVGTGASSGGISPSVGAPVHRESYVHGTLLPIRPPECPAGGPGAGPGAPCVAERGCVPAVPRARHVTVLRTGRDTAGTEPGLVEGRETQNGTHDTASATTAPSPRESCGQDGGGFAGDTAGSESSPGTAEGSPGEKHLPQAAATPVNATLGDGDRLGDPQTSITSSPQCPLEDAGSQAGPGDAGEGSTADGDNSISVTPTRTDSPPGASVTPETPSLEGSNDPGAASETPSLEGSDGPGATSKNPSLEGSDGPAATSENPSSEGSDGPGVTPENPSLERSDGPAATSENPSSEGSDGPGVTPENPYSEGSDAPEPSPKAPAPPKAEVELDGGETTGNPQGTTREPETSPDTPAKPPAPDPPAESPPDATEEDPELLVDMEIFVDTLRNMEPSEMRKAPKTPRQPRPSSLGRCAALPPIHEDRVAPRAPISLPEALRELLARGPAGRRDESPEEEMEIENPYLSPEERALARTLRGTPGDSAASDSRAEGNSLLGKLRQAGAEEKAKAAAGGLSERSVLFRGNVLKGMALLSHFLEHRAAAADELKPYSRLDNSVLYSRFMAPSAAPLELPGRDGGDTGLPTPRDHNGLGPGDHPVPEMAVLEAPSAGCVPLVTEEPESVMALCPADVLQENKDGFKINTRPGKIILFSEAGFVGQKREIWGDVPDATSWELSHTISIRVIRGGWVMYEKPRFHGRKCVLAEGDVEIDNPWTAYGQSGEPRGNRPFRIGSFKRVVRDYRTPEISLFTEENGEGARLKFTDSAEDTRTRGQALTAASIIVHSGLWLVYSKPFFDDDPYVLEPGGYPNLKAWGAKDPSICSMHPIRLGCPVVERPGEPQVLIYEATGFQGRSFTISRDIYDLKRLPGPALATVGSLRVLGGCWVGYEKEGFRGHQYLLEEGEYPDWRHWGGYGDELVSLRLIRTDFSDPALVLFEAMDFEEGGSVELSEALPDTQLAGYGTVTQSIHVLSGVWVAYEGTNFSGEQYVLEKGVYRNCEDWGAGDCRIASVQPILQVGEHNLHFVSKILLFSEPDFLGDHVSFEEDQDTLPAAFLPRSCRVRGGSWILFDGQAFAGEQHVLSEGEYPTLSAMGCLSSTAIRSLKKVPVFFSEPSIFLHGLECFEGKEIELNSEVRSLQAEGFNNHVLSVRVKGGIWVLCEHGDFRGRQWLLDCTEITNWLTYSGIQHVGSLYPIRQRRIYFRIRSRELELYLSVPDDVEDMKAGRVVVSGLGEQSSSVWYYEDGLIKNQVAPNMSLQVIGPAGKGAKAVLWSETRMPRQTWSIDSQGRIHSQMFEDMVLDVKGGRSYDRDHAIVWDVAEERPTQIWDIQVL